MPPAMDNKHVKLKFKDLKTVNWAKIQKCAGITLPKIAKEAVAKAVEGVETRKYKKPYLKVGLIKGNLFMRIKDGAKHVQDVKLVTNWEPPNGWVDEAQEPDEFEDQGDEGGDGGQLTNEEIEYRQKLDDVIADRRAVKLRADNTLASIRTFAQQAGQVAQLAEDELARVRRGQDVDGGGRRTGAATLARCVEQIEALAARAQTTYDEFFPDYERHRTLNLVDDLGIRPEDSRNLAKENFYNGVIKLLDRDMKAQKAHIDVSLQEVQAAVAQAATFTQHGGDSVEGNLLRVTALREAAAATLEKARTVLGAMTGDIEEAPPKILAKIEYMDNAPTQEERLAVADVGLGLFAELEDAQPRFDQHMAKLREIGEKLAAVPNALKKNNAIKPEYEQALAVLKDGIDYKKHWDKHYEKARQALKKVRAAAGK